MSEWIDKLRILWLLLMHGYETWRDHIMREDLDGAYCCDGRYCCCGGQTVREVWLPAPPEASDE